MIRTSAQISGCLPAQLLSLRGQGTGIGKETNDDHVYIAPVLMRARDGHPGSRCPSAGRVVGHSREGGNPGKMCMGLTTAYTGSGESLGFSFKDR